MGRLDKKVAIVTGAAQGLGAAYARAMAGEGARVSVCDINQPEATLEAIRAAGGEAIGFRTDVTDPAAVAAFVRKTDETFGSVDVLVNNAAFAGVATPKAFMEISSGEWDHVMATNARGTFELAKAVAPIMRRNRYGKIINVTSSLFFSGGAGRLHYIASKGAIVAITRALAHELGPDGIAVNCIAPGLTMSTHIRGKIEVMAPALAAVRQARCFKRDEEPEDLVGTVIFLASADSDFITGQTIVVDGGEIMH